MVGSKGENRWEAIAAALMWAAIAGLVVTLVSAAAGPGYGLFRLIPNGYNEGWNAYWAEVAWSGGELYPAIDSPISNNYPPMSFYIVGGLGRLLGDNIFAGRLLALISLIVVAANMFIWLRIEQVSRSVATFAAALFLATFSAYAPAYIAMNDPQLLAHAFMMTSVVILWRYDFSRRALVAAALLMVFGGTIKHLLIALPLATTAWIALYRRQQLATWLIVSGSAVAATVAVLYLTQGPNFFHDMASSRLYSRQLVETGIRRVWQAFGFLVILSGTAGIAYISRFSSKVVREQAAFVLLYLVLAAAIGGLAAGGKGVDRNTFFDFLIATSLAVAIGVEHIRTRPRNPGRPSTGYQPEVKPTPRWVNPLVGSAIAAGCCAIFLVEAGSQWPTRWRLLQQTDAREADAVRVIGDIKRLGGGTAACEELSLCYWAGSAFKVDFFNYGQKLATAALPAGDCEETFTAESISLVQVNSPHGDPRLSFRLPTECNEAIAREYSSARGNSHGRLMLPAALD
jgi:6-pyruvoyl-tetrahydropterin synthase related domain